MAMNMQFAQLVVGAALIDRRFSSQLLRSRSEALAAVTQHACAPDDLEPTEEDRRLLSGIHARTLAEFALGVERLRALGGRDGRGRASASAAVAAARAG
jgi:hypothetical protein